MNLKIVLFMWQFGLIDTFSAVSFFYNVGTQYGSIVLTALVTGNATQLPTMIFEPIAGLGVAYQFVKAVQPAAERRARVATLAALLSASATTAATSNPLTPRKLLRIWT